MRVGKKRNIAAGEEVEVAPEATDLLFETEDVAELLAEVTEQEVTAETTEDGSVEFAVGEDDIYTVTPEGDEEVLEAVRKPLQEKKSVKASKNNDKSSVKASRVIRKVPTKK